MDLMFTAKDLIGLYYNTTESLFLLVVFYLIILLPVSLLGTYLEHKLGTPGVRQSTRKSAISRRSRENAIKEGVVNVGN